MTLTLAHGPLSSEPPETVNYEVAGPEHRLLLDEFPRRVRAVLGGQTVVDSRRGKLLHETGHLPQLYVPEDDIRADLIEPTGHTTHCPFKGDARHWSVRVGDRVAENAVWAYPEPLEGAAWLRGLRAVDWNSMDGWLDEDEEVAGHLRDPYHRVDVRATSTHVRVLAADRVIADTHDAKVLSETGLANRLYIPADDVPDDLLEPSDKRTHCPYKGEAAWWSLTVDGRRIEDAAWSYPEPLEDALKAGGHLCFDHDAITTEAAGEGAG